MNAKKILVPIDLMRSPCDALLFARDMAADQPVCVTLLYVLNLNIVTPDARLHDEMVAQGAEALRKLAWFFFGEEGAARTVVRMGLPHEQILAEAREEAADLIVLTGPARPSWRRRLGLGTAQKIIDRAACPAVVLPRGKTPAPRQREAPVGAVTAPFGAISPVT
jgi:nucleotide-binding universal stress UspA family protein